MKILNLNHIKLRFLFMFWLAWGLYFTPVISFAHGFGERYDLTVPLFCTYRVRVWQWYYLSELLASL